MEKRFIFYIILIIIILVLVFLSQQAYSRGIAQSLVSAATSQASTFLAKGTSLAMPNIGTKISEQLQNGGGVIQSNIDQEKQKISDAQKNIENYFSGIANSILHPGTSTSCQPTQTSTN